MNEFTLGIALAIIAGSAAVALAFWRVWRTMRNLRAPRPVESALLWWDENPVSDFRQDPFVAFLALVHRSAIVVMGVLAALAGIRALAAPRGWLPPYIDIPPWSGSMWLVFYVAIPLSIGLAWYTIGATWMLPIAGRRLRPIRVVLTEEGIYRGQFHMPWDMFGSVRQDAKRDLIHLSSSRSGGFVALTLRPPTGDLRATAVEMIRARGTTAERGQAPRVRHRLGFALVYVMSALPLVLLGFWLYPSAPVCACTAQGIGAWLATGLGSRVILAYH